MSLRPLDMQVMIPKMQEVSHMKQMENQYSENSQNQIMAQQQKENLRQAQVVNESPKDQNAEQEADAREEGKNKYTYEPPKKHPKEEKVSDTTDIEGYHSIDIKI